jgi:hypothetical protein
MAQAPDGMKAVRPGDEVLRLLDAAEGDETTIVYTLAMEPDYWCSMIALAIPWLIIYRQKGYCQAHKIKPDAWKLFN